VFDCCENQPATVAIKRGDTLTLACTYKQNGTAATVQDYTIRAQVRDSSGILVAELTAAKANQTTNPGVFTLSGGLTTSWPIDELRSDIQFVDPDNVTRSSQTFNISVSEDITQ